MEYKEETKTEKYRFLNEDKEVKGWCWEISIEDARKRLELRIAAGNEQLKGCIVSPPYNNSQADNNKRSLAKIEKETGVVKLTVRGHKDFKPELEEFARLDLVARGLEE